MTEPELTSEALKDRICRDTAEILYRDIALEGDPRDILAELFGMTMTAALSATRGAPLGLRITMLMNGVPDAFKAALSASVDNLLSGRYETEEPSDA